MQLFTSLFMVTLSSLFVTHYFVASNDTLVKNEKIIWRTIIITVMIGLSAEYLGTLYDPRMSNDAPIIILKLVKFIEYTFSPLPILLFLQLISKNKKFISIYKIVLIINALLEIISAFTRHIYCVNPDGTFTRGKFFFIFVTIYSFGFICLIFEFLQLKKQYNTDSLELCLNNLNNNLEKVLEECRKDIPYLPTVSSGFAEYRNKIDSIEEIFITADKNMYIRKEDMKK